MSGSHKEKRRLHEVNMPAIARIGFHRSATAPAPSSAPDVALSRAHERATQQVETLLRHYEASKSRHSKDKQREGNPVFLWAAIWQLTKWPELLGLPAELHAYLQGIAGVVLDLAEGIDMSRAPPLSRCDTQEQMIQMFGNHRAFMAEVTVGDSKSIGAHVLRALGFRTKRGKSVFDEYRRVLEAQTDHDLSEIREIRHRHARLRDSRRGRGATFPEAEAEAHCRDVRTISRRRKKAQDSLALGRIEPKNQFGPAGARRHREIFGDISDTS
jgi:hypothetical protein